MPFCEECGAKLTPGVAFCEECGAKVDIAESTSTTEPVASPSKCEGRLSTFSGDWMSSWKKAAEQSSGEELGIILTDADALVSQLSCSKRTLLDCVEDYIRAAANRGVQYHFLDISDNRVGNANGEDVQSVVDLLLKIVAVARPKYLFILGNEEIVNVAVWENQARDDDAEVLADLAYVTLDTFSPWEGQNFKFKDAIRVGRLPSYSGEGLNEFCSYFENAKKGIGTIDKIIPYGLSAKVWQGASEAQFQGISKGKLQLAPSTTLANVSSTIPYGVNLLYFNLHGSDQAEHWYGQEGCSYPEAFSPKVIKNISGPYFLGVEACYGARYTDGLTPDDSIVLAAMQNGCLALLGSSKIAFGPCNAPGTCADIMIGVYVKEIANGESAGDAYCKAMTELMSSEDPDDCTIKTLAEFSLYGDPSARTGKNKSKSLFGKAFGGVAKGIHVPMPDVRNAVKAMRISQDSKAAKAFQKNLESAGSSLTFDIRDYMQGIEPEYFQVGEKDLYQAHFSKNVGLFNQAVKVYFDGNGKIKKELHSK